MSKEYVTPTGGIAQETTNKSYITPVGAVEQETQAAVSLGVPKTTKLTLLGVG